MRTQFERIIRKTGMKPWGKLWQNLRSSRETELTERFPLHVVCGWLGNSPRVAGKHYLQTTESHYQDAVVKPTATKAAQNPAQSAHGTKRHEPTAAMANRDDTPKNAVGACEEDGGMGAAGLEPATSRV